VQELLEHVRSLVSGQAAERGIAIEVARRDSSSARLDPEQMTQALLNIVQNALEATPRGGTVALSATMTPASVRFSISDTGKGIPTGTLDKIFNLYYSTKEDGTGLGLPITQQIVSQHDGILDVSSQEGRGTVITIEIPRT
jgi:signal transduction histidine kinase